MTLNADFAFDAPNVAGNFRLLEKITNDAQDGLIVTDEAGRIILFSKTAERLFGYDAIEVVGQNMTVLMLEPHRSHHARYVTDFRTSGQGKILGVGPRELPARHKSGAMVPIELSVSDVPWNGRRVFVGICRNISERVTRDRELREAKNGLAANVALLEETNRTLQVQQRETLVLAQSLRHARDEALKATRAKSEFLATMSHEMRTPLNGIIGMAQVLANTELAPEQREYLDVVAECSTRLLALINEILDLAKIEAGLMTLEVRKTNLRDFLRHIDNHWRHRAIAKGLAFRMTVENDVPTVVAFDEVRLRQVLENLLSNAFKFTERGEIQIRVSLVCGAGNQTDIRFEVRDTGRGIAVENHERIFQPFVQSDSSITRRFGGTGLGLAICKKIIALMGGAIGMESAPRQGATFWVTCPCPAEIGAGAHARAQEADAASRPRTDCPVLDVLVVEDNEINQKVVTTMLTLLGHRATIANNGLEALALTNDSAFDVILMDLQMPEMDGAAAARAIRQRADRSCRTPIIGLTASALESDRNACLAAGMTAVITKPIEIAALTAALSPHANRAFVPAVVPPLSEGTSHQRAPDTVIGDRI